MKHKTTLAPLAALLLCLALAGAAQAAPPIHARKASLDVTGLNHACGTAVDSKGDLYAASAGAEEIEVFAPASHSTPIAQISDSNEPCALAVDNHGDLLVSERGTGNVVLYAPDEYPLSGSPTYSPPVTVVATGEAAGISIDPFDERLYVAEGDHVSTYGNEAQQLRIANATGGTYKLRFEGEETSPLPYNASDEEIEESLEALAAIGSDATTVTTTSATQKRVSFTGPLAYRDAPQLELLSSLEGGEIQKVTVKATTGTFKLRFEGEETAPIPYGASAAELKAALEALSNVGPGALSVSGGPGDATGTAPYFVSFASALGNVGPIESNQSGLSPGTVDVTTTHEGVEGLATTVRSGGLGTDEVQKVKVLNATGGTFTLSFEGEETGPIDFDAPARESVGTGSVEEALEELPAIGSGNVSVVFEFSPIYLERRYRVEFQDALGHTNVPQLGASSSLSGNGSQSVAVQSATTQGFSGLIGEGELGQATSVAPYTYEDFEGGHHRLYLAVADAEGDTFETFSGEDISSLKHRRTIAGVDQDKDPETPDQQFGFGPAGAYVSADPGNANPASPYDCLQVEEQACTAGHVYLYDAAHEALDELDATGHFLDRIATAGLQDAEPTQAAVDRSGSGADGTLYVSSGAGTGASILAFKPLLQPGREELAKPISKELPSAQSVAVDDHGDVYVGAGSTVHVYKPEGEEELKELTSFSAPTALDLALDSEGNVYLIDEKNKKLFYYHPDKYPPDASTKYTKSSELANTGLLGVAVDPASDDAYLYKGGLFSGSIQIFKPPAEGSALVETCGAGLGLPSGSSGWDIDVYGATGEVFLSANGSGILAIRCGAEEEKLRQFQGNGCPSGKLGAQPSLALDQANGHIVEYANNQTGNSAREYEASGACVAQFGTFSYNAGGYRVAIDNSCALQEPPLTGAACEAFDPAYGNAYVAYDALNNGAQPYDLTAFGPLEYPTPPEHKLTLEKAGSGSGKVTSSPAGIACGPACAEESAEFPNEAVTLSASAAAGSQFNGWGLGECESEPELGQKCVVTTSSAKTVHATFAPILHALTVEVEGPGEVSGPGPIACGSECEASFPEGETVALTATPDAQAHFVEWSGPGAGACAATSTPTCEVEMSEDKTVKAIFAPDVATLPLAVHHEGTGEGAVAYTPGGFECPAGEDCEQSFPEGEEVTLTASPAEGSLFVAWKNCDSGGVHGRQCTVNVTENHKPIGAKFEAANDVTVEKAGTGTGSTSGVTCANTCTQATAAFLASKTVTLKAKPYAKNSEFTGWSASPVPCMLPEGPKGPCVLSGLGADETVEAEFSEKDKETLTVAKAGGGQGAVKSKPAGINCSYTCASTTAYFYKGTPLSLEATVQEGKGSAFGGFQAGSGSASACSVTPCLFTIEAPSSLTARFE